jgi:thiol-disulfide isomerase/thioredoxin
MKRIILAASLLGFASGAVAQNREIKFEHGDLEALKQKAKQENKLIFIDAYTTWCGPCKWMASKVFTQDAVADYFNANFINLKLDMEDGGEGTAFGQQYEVRCYPNLLFIDGNGNVVHRGAGGRDADDFIAFAKDSQNPNTRFSSVKQKYEGNKQQTAFLKDYIKMLAESCLPTAEPLANYFSMQQEADLSSAENWEMILAYTEDYGSREFKYLMNNLAKFRSLYSEEAVNGKIAEVLTNKARAIIEDPASSMADFNAYKQEVMKAEFPTTDNFLFSLDCAYYSGREQWEEYAQVILERGDAYLSEETYNEVSWTLYEKSNNKAALEKAAGWMKGLLDARPGESLYAEQDTYASLLYKLGKKKEAKEAAQKAIEMAKDAGMAEEEYHATVDLLEKIKRMK